MLRSKLCALVLTSLLFMSAVSNSARAESFNLILLTSSLPDITTPQVIGFLNIPGEGGNFSFEIAIGPTVDPDFQHVTINGDFDLVINGFGVQGGSPVGLTLFGRADISVNDDIVSGFFSADDDGDLGARFSGGDNNWTGDFLAPLSAFGFSGVFTAEWVEVPDRDEIAEPSTLGIALLGIFLVFSARHRFRISSQR